MIQNKTFLSSLVKYYFNGEELFDDINISKIKSNRKLIRNKYGNSINLRTLCARILAYFLYLIILDIIKNNVTFIFPSRNLLVLGIKKLKDNEVLNYMKQYKPKMYDFFGSGCVLPRITLFYRYRNREIRTKEIVLNYSLTKEFFDNINSGKVYG